jgi:two-component system response regulator YesN
MKILLLEDDVLQMFQLKKYFQKMGHTVYTGENGVDGLENTIKYDPDVIVCDVNMPYLTGVDLYHLLENHGDYAKRILLISSNTRRVDMLDIPNAHKNTSFFKKPLNLNELNQRVMEFEVHGTETKR